LKVVKKHGLRRRASRIPAKQRLELKAFAFATLYSHSGGRRAPRTTAYPRNGYVGRTCQFCQSPHESPEPSLRAGESYAKIPDAGAAELPGKVGPNAIVSAAGVTGLGQSAKTRLASLPATRISTGMWEMVRPMRRIRVGWRNTIRTSGIGITCLTKLSSTMTLFRVTTLKV
jgi:hypothetical protein